MAFDVGIINNIIQWLLLPLVLLAISALICVLYRRVERWVEGGWYSMAAEREGAPAYEGQTILRGVELRAGDLPDR
jgi:hypothetical protein